MDNLFVETISWKVFGNSQSIDKIMKGNFQTDPPILLQLKQAIEFLRKFNKIALRFYLFQNTDRIFQEKL